MGDAPAPAPAPSTLDETPSMTFDPSPEGNLCMLRALAFLAGKDDPDDVSVQVALLENGSPDLKERLEAEEMLEDTMLSQIMKFCWPKHNRSIYVSDGSVVTCCFERQRRYHTLATNSNGVSAATLPAYYDQLICEHRHFRAVRGTRTADVNVE